MKWNYRNNCPDFRHTIHFSYEHCLPWHLFDLVLSFVLHRYFPVGSFFLELNNILKLAPIDLENALNCLIVPERPSFSFELDYTSREVESSRKMYCEEQGYLDVPCTESILCCCGCLIQEEEASVEIFITEEHCTIKINPRDNTDLDPLKGLYVEIPFLQRNTSLV